jgi:hypothetical protein
VQICKHYNISTGKLRKGKFIYKIEESEDKEVKSPVYTEIKLIDGTLKYSFEALPVLFMLGGHNKNLLLFLMTYCMNDDCTFTWNSVIGAQYADFYQSITGERPTYNVIRQSIPDLVAQNIIQLKEPEKYMLNPILYFGTSQYIKNDLIKKYALLAAHRNKSVIESIYSE